MEQGKRIRTDDIECYGCTACVHACPVQAISMKENQKGFLSPVIDDGNCINCGKCSKVCQIGHERTLLNIKTEKCFGIKTEDCIRRVSSSGGIFTELSNQILSMGGICYGAAYEENLTVVHRRAVSSEKCSAFRESKYVQSDLNNCFRQIEKDLENNVVLFSGTPCQVAGIKNI